MTSAKLIGSDLIIKILRANPTKWSNTLKQLVACSQRIFVCL